MDMFPNFQSKQMYTITLPVEHCAQKKMTKVVNIFENHLAVEQTGRTVFIPKHVTV